MAEREGFTKTSEINLLTEKKCTHLPIEYQGFLDEVATPLSTKKQNYDDLLGFDSALDRPLLATRFPNQFAKQKQNKKYTLRELAEIVAATLSPDKTSAPFFKLARFSEQKSPKGSLRHNANVISIDGIEGDYDQEQMPITQGAEMLKAAGIAALLFESPSSSPDGPRWRVACPCSTSLAPSERARLVARLNGALGGTLDNVSHTLSQSFYYGGIEGKPKPKIILVEGGFIDDAHNLDKGAIGRRGKTVDGDSEEYQRDDSGNGAAFRKAMAIYLEGGSIDHFEEWAVDNPWKDYERDSEHAIDRTWERAGIEAGKIALSKLRDPLEFEDLGPDLDSKQRQGLNITCFADIEPENIEWVWQQRLARGKISILAGDPGQGKSQISLHLASIISNGGNWPDGGKAPKGHVVILSAEDGAADTTLPRLMATGANRQNVHAVRSVTDKGRDRSFNLGADLKQLDSLCTRLGDVVLVVIDPVTSYLGDIDSHRTSDVRAVLEPLGNWAEKAKVAVLAISHPPKAAQAKAINAVTGSLAFVAAARIAMVAIADPETKGRSLLLSVKNNIAQAPKGLGYRIEGCSVEGPSGPIQTSAIAWDDKEVTLTADQALSATRGADKPQEAMSDALAVLRDRLGFGESVPANEMTEAAAAHGISGATLRRARKQLGVITDKSGFNGGWVWRIPTEFGDVI